MHFSTEFEDIVYRSSSPKYASETDLLTGLGSKKEGGRWNPSGIATVYASLTPQTAMQETLAHNKYYGIPVQDAMPRTFVAIKPRLRFILDLRIGSIRRRIRVSEERMLTTDWRFEARRGRVPITQQLGKAAYEVELEGLIVPSAADPTGCNLLVFPDNLRPGSRIRVLNAGQL